MNPFLSTPEAAQFWREQQQACEEARRLLVKTPAFAAFLGAGGTINVVAAQIPDEGHFIALLKDGDSTLMGTPFMPDWLGGSFRAGINETVSRLAMQMSEAKYGAAPAPTAAPTYTKPAD